MGVLRAGALPGLHMQPTAQIFDGSLKFDRRESHYLSRTFSAGNRKTFTISFWVKASDHSEGAAIGTGGGNIFSAGTVGAGARTQLGFGGPTNGSNEDKFQFGFNATGSSWKSLTTDAFFRDFSAWQHFVVSVDCTLSEPNRAKVYCNGVEKSLSGTMPGDENQPINSAVGHAIGRYNPESADYFNGCLSNFYFIDGLYLGPEYFGFTDPLTGTWRPKKFRAVGKTINDGTDWSANFSGNGGTQPTTAFDGDGPRQDGYVHSGSALTVNFSPPLSGHIVVYGGTGAGSHNSTTTDTFTLSDGSVLSSQEKYDVAPYFSKLDFGEKENITSLVCSGGYTLYAVSVDGVFLKDSTTQNLDFGTNGFYLPMDNEDDFSVDKSGKGNNWTQNNFNGTFNDPDILKDSPSGAIFGGRKTGITTTSSGPSNYATFNNLRYSGYTTSDRVFTDGNLRMLGRGDGVSNFGVTTGKFYAEVFVERIKSGEEGQGYIGVIAEPGTYSERGWPTSKIAALRDSGGGGSNNFYGDGKGTTTTTWTEGDTISVAFDADAAKVWIAKNGSYINSGNPATGATPSFSGLTFKDYYFFVSDNKPSSSQTTDGNRYQINFGQKPFKYAPPQGYLPLNTASITPEKVIPHPEEYVGVATYNGTGGPTIIPGLSMKPDFIWIKNRSAQQKHTLVNSVSTTATGEYLASNEEDDEGTGVHISGVETRGGNAQTAFGISIADPNADTIWYNDSSYDYVALCWKAGGSSNTFNIDDVGYASASAAGLDGGSVTPSGASVGTKQGFSIITWSRSSGTDTISHGLSQAPTFIIQKSTSADKRWQVGWEVEGWDRRLYLNLTDADSDSSSFGWSGNYGPTNTLIRTGGTSYVDGDMIAFCWHDVPGLQKFGKFAGNNSADGVFVELGFKPAVLLIKEDAGTGDWIIWDNVRDKVNPVNRQIWPYTDSGTYGVYDQVGSNYPLDFLSNGFKMRTTDADMNGNSTYLYAAWAEEPRSNLFGGQSLAR